jgi:hypothetical protein
VRGVVLARRLGFFSAMRAPSVFLPDPHLSELVKNRLRAVQQCLRERGPEAARAMMPHPDFLRVARARSATPPAPAASPASWRRRARGRSPAAPIRRRARDRRRLPAAPRTDTGARGRARGQDGGAARRRRRTAAGAVRPGPPSPRPRRTRTGARATDACSGAARALLGRGWCDEGAVPWAWAAWRLRSRGR